MTLGPTTLADTKNFSTCTTDCVSCWLMVFWRWYVSKYSPKNT
jgi:hypothetical protein